MTTALGEGSAAYVGEPNVFVSAAGWIQAALLGSVATTVAILAVAAVGLLMLTGRVNVRRGAIVILGCFILFGASTIANGLRGAAAAIPGETPLLVAVSPRAPVIDLSPVASDPAPASSDPYAGASIRR